MLGKSSLFHSSEWNSDNKTHCRKAIQHEVDACSTKGVGEKEEGIKKKDL